MRKGTTGWLIAAAVLVIAGATVFFGAMALQSWDFTKLNTIEYELVTTTVPEEFHSISIKTDTVDLTFLPSDDGTCKVVSYEPVKIRHAMSVQGGTLIVVTEDTREWYEHIALFSVGKASLQIYLPENVYEEIVVEESTGDVEIHRDLQLKNIDITADTGDVRCFASVSEGMQIALSTGDIYLEELSAGGMDLTVSSGAVNVSSVDCKGDIAVSVSTGNVKLTDVTCKNLLTAGNTGDILLQNVIAEEEFSVVRTTGDVEFDGCDAGQIFVTTDTGDVKGSLLSEKIFMTETDTGSVEVPKTVAGGKCEITTDTGDIRIQVR